MAVRGQKSSMALRRRGRWGGRILGPLLALLGFIGNGALGAEFQGGPSPASGQELPALRAAPAPGVEALRRALHSLRLPEDSASLWVLDLDRDVVLTAEGAERPRAPASLVKLLPMGAALLSLGPAFRWHTEAWAEGPLRDGVLQGDLLLWGEGDPFFNDEALYRFVSALRGAGVTRIEGALRVDGRALSPTARPRDAFDGQGDRLYNLPAHALLPNFTAATVALRPGASAVEAQVSPLLPSLRVENRLKLVPGPCRGYQRGVAINVLGSARDTLRLEGTFPEGCQRYALTRSVLTPERYLEDRFRVLFEALGGQWEGAVIPGTLSAEARAEADSFDRLPPRAAEQTPAPAARLLRQPSPPLDEIVWRLGKNSNNVMTTQLLLTLGRVREGAGTEAAGWQALRAVYGAAGVDLSDAVLTHPAGLAREDRLRPAQLGAVLRLLWHSSRMPEFLHALPIAGVDGTLKSRFEDTPLAAQAHLKTGTLAGVSNVAGVLRTRQGRRLAVVLMLEAEEAERGLGPSLQEAVLQALWAD
jgi:D-alanyl-D-alanine carboxypeptidase/D-alanyl-D-alanine-endopeptidase (penicillin-binding protein 4)